MTYHDDKYDLVNGPDTDAAVPAPAHQHLLHHMHTVHLDHHHHDGFDDDCDDYDDDFC